MPALPGLSQDWPTGHEGAAQQVSSTQFSETQSVGSSQPAPFGAGVGVSVGGAVSVGVAGGVTVGVEVGPVHEPLQKPVEFSVQTFWPPVQLSATPCEQSVAPSQQPIDVPMPPQKPSHPAQSRGVATLQPLTAPLQMQQTASASGTAESVISSVSAVIATATCERAR